MSVTIRIDQDVYESLKAKAEPFVDTPNSVLRRLLNLDGLSAAAGSATMAVQPPPTRSPGRGDSGTPASHKRKRKRRAKRASFAATEKPGARIRRFREALIAHPLPDLKPRLPRRSSELL